MKPTPSEPSTPIPGDIYLCQVNPKVSCAACCGLYNIPDCSFDGLKKMLSDRSRRFAALPRRAEDIIEFGHQIESIQVRNRPWADFHHCPFIGLIGHCRQRVGCLLHPLAEGNDGVDYRGLSYYGGMACRQYFCPSHRELSPTVKTILRQLAGSWYEYGLVVTETVLLGALVSEVEKRLAAPLPLRGVLDNPEASRVMRDLLFLKIRWPYRQGNGKGLCNYFFSDRSYGKEPVDYGAAGRQPVDYDVIFTELASRFQTVDEVRGARQRLEFLFQQAAGAVGQASL